MASVGSTAARGVIFLIELYRHAISPMRLPTCRFSPTCSQYAVDALTEYGLVRGGWLAIVRLVKCGPWHRGGWDPIPERRGTSRVGENGQAANDPSGTRALRAESETRV
jgi:uncharacterized protein